MASPTTLSTPPSSTPSSTSTHSLQHSSQSSYSRSRSPSLHSQDLELSTLDFFPLNTSLAYLPSSSRTTTTPPPAPSRPFSPSRTLHISTSRSTTSSTKSKIVVKDDNTSTKYTLRRTRASRWHARDTLSRHLLSTSCEIGRAGEEREYPLVQTRYAFAQTKAPEMTILPRMEGESGSRGSLDIPTITLTSDDEEDAHEGSVGKDGKGVRTIALHRSLVKKRMSFTLASGLRLQWRFEHGFDAENVQIQSLALYAVSPSAARNAEMRMKVAQLVVGEKGALGLDLAAEVSVDREMGVDEKGHLVRGCVDEGVVVASGLAMARRVGWMC